MYTAPKLNRESMQCACCERKISDTESRVEITPRGGAKLWVHKSCISTETPVTSSWFKIDPKFFQVSGPVKLPELKQKETWSLTKPTKLECTWF